MHLGWKINYMCLYWENHDLEGSLMQNTDFCYNYFPKFWSTGNFSFVNQA